AAAHDDEADEQESARDTPGYRAAPGAGVVRSEWWRFEGPRERVQRSGPTSRRKSSGRSPVDSITCCRRPRAFGYAESGGRRETSHAKRSPRSWSSRDFLLRSLERKRRYATDRAEPDSAR